MVLVTSSRSQIDVDTQMRSTTAASDVENPQMRSTTAASDVENPFDGFVVTHVCDRRVDANGGSFKFKYHRFACFPCWNFTATTTSTWRDERTTTTRKNACDQETMMKIRVVIIFIIAQVVLAR